MSKQLSMTQVKKENQIYNQTVDIETTVGGEEYIIKLKPFLSQDVIRDIVNERVEFVNLCKQENVNITEEEEQETLGYFIIKHATDIKFTKSKKAKTIYAEFKEAYKSKLFKVILQSIPEDTMKDIMDYWFELIEASGKIENQLKQFQEVYKGLDLENRDVIEKAFNKNSKDTPVN